MSADRRHLLAVVLVALLGCTAPQPPAGRELRDARTTPPRVAPSTTEVAP